MAGAVTYLSGAGELYGLCSEDCMRATAASLTDPTAPGRDEEALDAIVEGDRRRSVSRVRCWWCGELLWDGVAGRIE